jgi:hypothetical protein
VNVARNPRGASVTRERMLAVLGVPRRNIGCATRIRTVSRTRAQISHTRRTLGIRESKAERQFGR